MNRRSCLVGSSLSVTKKLVREEHTELLPLVWRMRENSWINCQGTEKRSEV